MKTAKKNLTLATVIAVSLSGCAMDDSMRTTAEGAGIGAVIGGALGYMIGGRDGAAIGAVVGGGIGFAIGNDIAKRKQGYANLEDALDGEIAYYNELNKTVAENNKQLSRSIAKLDKQARKLRRQYKAGQVTKQRMLAERQSIQKQSSKNQKYIAELNKQYKQGSDYLNSDLKRSSDKRKISQLRKEQQRLKREIQKANQNQRQFAKIEQRMSV